MSGQHRSMVWLVSRRRGRWSFDLVSSLHEKVAASRWRRPHQRPHTNNCSPEVRTGTEATPEEHASISRNYNRGRGGGEGEGEALTNVKT